MDLVLGIATYIPTLPLLTEKEQEPQNLAPLSHLGQIVIKMYTLLMFQSCLMGTNTKQASMEKFIIM